jgi:hypothetical protein
MLVSDRYTSQEPVLPDWSAPAMGAPPKADQPGKPLFGMGTTLPLWISTTSENFLFGPGGVGALPLAAGINVGGIFFSSSSSSGLIANSPRRGYRRVLKFFIGS